MEAAAIVEIQWRDAFFDYDGKDDREDYIVSTVGYLVEGPPGFVCIAAEMLPLPDGYRAVTKIPMACFRSMMVLAVRPQDV